MAGRVLRVVRRTLLTIVGVQLALAIGMSLVDSYRRRGKKPKPFPTTAPRTVEIGEGTMTTYTYGSDLYADMIAAIESAQRQVFFETYIWKGDATGERFKQALADEQEAEKKKKAKIRGGWRKKYEQEAEKSKH